MGVIDLSAYKPVPGTLGDANQVANGFQAIQNLVNGSIDNNNFAAGKIFDPAKLMQNAAIDGDPLVWDNSLVKWVPASTLAAGRPRAPRVVVSTMAGGPPSSPVDQDIWIATAVDANGTRWAFQYNAGSASTYKWEFIGGTKVWAVTGSGSTVSGALVDMTSGPSLTVARTGEYFIEGSADHVVVTVNNAITGLSVGNGGVQISGNVGTSTNVGLSGVFTPLGTTTGPVIVTVPGYVAKLQVSVNGGATATFTSPWITAIPRRIA